MFHLVGKLQGPFRRRSISAVLLAVCLALLSSSCRLPTTRKADAGLRFEVYWPQDEAKDLRLGSPVVMEKIQVGEVTRLATKYDSGASQTRIFAQLTVREAEEPLRIEDAFSIGAVGPRNVTCIEISPRKGDRMKWRPIENGMLIQGKSRSWFSEKAGGAWEGVKEKSSTLSEKAREVYKGVKGKMTGEK